MKLIAQLKLLPSPAQADLLKRTLEEANAACNYISGIAWQSRTFGKFDIQKVCYDDVRDTFQLAAQLAIRCIAKVAGAYKRDRTIRHTFRPDGAIPYDSRILSYNRKGAEVSIWLMGA